jgi:hypothetical protein
MVSQASAGQVAAAAVRIDSAASDAASVRPAAAGFCVPSNVAHRAPRTPSTITWLATPPASGCTPLGLLGAGVGAGVGDGDALAELLLEAAATGEAPAAGAADATAQSATAARLIEIFREGRVTA